MKGKFNELQDNYQKVQDQLTEQGANATTSQVKELFNVVIEPLGSG